MLKGIGLIELALVFSLLGVYFTLMTLHSIMYMPRHTHTPPLSLLLKPGSYLMEIWELSDGRIRASLVTVAIYTLAASQIKFKG